MKRSIILSLLVAAALPALAQSSATAAGNAVAARILCKIQIANTLGLGFGTIVADAAQTVTVDASANTRTTTGAAGNLLTGGDSIEAGPFQRASFTITGCGGKDYSVTLPAASSVTLSDGGVNTMTVLSFNSDKTGVRSLGSAPFTSGTDTLRVGGALSVGANQAAGNYTGTFDVTVQYL